MTINASDSNNEALSIDTDFSVEFLFENRFTNVLQRSSDKLYEDLLEGWGQEKCIENGYKMRSKHEVYSGLAYVTNTKGIQLDAEVVNLPFTVLNRINKPAETAFTERTTERRKIYLVPDHTPTRIYKDVSAHTAGFDALLSSKSISVKMYERVTNEMEKLDVAGRVGASIIHEMGHILTYRAMDKLGIEKTAEAYQWLDELGYIDNCSKRVVSFSDRDPLFMLNIALEQLAEDYRLSHYIREGYPIASLPHSISYIQDIVNPETFLEGVEIMSKLLTVEKKKSALKEKGTSLDFVIPYGEGDRSVTAQFAIGKPTPITKEKKMRDLKALREFDSSYLEL